MTDPLRFPPIPDGAWPDQIADLRDGFAGKLNVYRTMAHDPELLKAWAPLRQHVVIDNALGPQLSEVTILRTGHNLESSYEWNQHVHRARACGMSDAQIGSIRGPLAAMDADDATIARAVDELFGVKRLSPDTQKALIALVGEKGLFDVIATVGFYSTLGYILNSCGTPLDDDISADLADKPFTG
ncbi:Carboxymuconolactone decarboxylase family protein [Thalassovita gelatinovora]|uniref:Carboxymuconolactone decarboxylase family protein n=1 Tax=Thalassovita gelatinovora TaxID=53501 RepID=A0A0P1F9T7_THAGE|nr:carboxymuconolactone decarboxylase family protein [Thalassovita gelatinovora]QIZ81127.1 carboxymuconolactone decarboxylase family protein [Thalassovita gelatinovora]CUH64859.1 Carboxymuconolactone decarboxylase family protein [Thalassovita gelatinovora]SEP90784.1 Alkylhydroperoxidase family enzyme, contains CxxC motif [Thalassovita gelatinovora]